MTRIFIFLITVAILGEAGWLLFLYHTSLGLINANQSLPRQYNVGEPSASPYQYVVLGDSTAASVGAPTLEDSYPYKIAQAVAAEGHFVHVSVLAISGARMSDLQTGQLPELKNLHPDLITITIGANDATHFTPTASYQQSIQAIIPALQSSGAKILWATTPDMHEPPALPLPFAWLIGQRAATQNQILQDALKGTAIVTVDLYTKGKLERKNLSLYAVDRFHPSPSGYTRWANLFSAARLAPVVQP